jgi:predicted GIY-YIG superfamily endonuclease
MPKEDVDYSNTIIYKIYCKDETITDVYVGYTTNFTQRKYSHKIACNNMNNNLKIRVNKSPALLLIIEAEV